MDVNRSSVDFGSKAFGLSRESISVGEPDDWSGGKYALACFTPHRQRTSRSCGVERRERTQRAAMAPIAALDSIFVSFWKMATA